MPSKMVLLSWAEGDQSPVDPGYGVGNPPYPSHGLPGYGGGHPSHPIYNPPYPSQGPGFPVQLPVFPFDPTKPDQSLPPNVSTGPIVPGKKFIVKWMACSGLILVPDHSLPETEPEPK